MLMRDIEPMLLDLRLDHNLKQHDVAKKLNIKEDTYSKWERGINDIPLDKINELANIYNVSIDYLLGRTEKNILTASSKIDLSTMQKRLFNLRKENHLSQSALAEKIGFFQRTYAHYEQGTNIPTTYKLFHIASFYNVSMDYLLGRTDKKEIQKKGSAN